VANLAARCAWGSGLPGAWGEAVSSYVVDLRCECGKVHRVSNDFRLQNGPNHAGTVAELYRTDELPPSLARLLRDLVWCDQAGEYIEMGDPARVILSP
jgi:hypothetical protein